MQATADSKTESVKETGVDKMFCNILILDRALPNKVISR
jgi:hypothetical protein